MLKRRWIIVLLVSVVLIIAGITGYGYYRKAFAPNVITGSDETYIYIRTGSDMGSVAAMFDTAEVLKDVHSFLWLANKKNYGAHIYPGRYLLKDGMSNNDLVNLLRSGKQTPVNVTFNNIRTEKELAGKVSKYIEADSLSFMQYFDTTTFFSNLGLTKKQILVLFHPDTYEFKWNTSAGQFLKRMKKEHDVFWNEKRRTKASDINLSEAEVYTLASVVYSETKKSDEAARVAGVYINRLAQGIPLQADPTIIFAIGDFTKTRVLFADLEIESPYNTYKYTGLPPGPICMPPKSYIDAVLNYEKHDYLFFCAKEDFSGYSNFAETLTEHNRNAFKYQQALNALEKNK